MDVTSGKRRKAADSRELTKKHREHTNTRKTPRETQNYQKDPKKDTRSITRSPVAG